MTIMALTELGIKDIWVKALTTEHGQIATRIGAHHVVYPEADMGERVAHLISGRMMDFIEFDDGFAIAKIHAPERIHNSTLAAAAVREIRRDRRRPQAGQPGFPARDAQHSGAAGRSADRLGADP